MLYGTLADRCKNMKITQNTSNHKNAGGMRIWKVCVC